MSCLAALWKLDLELLAAPVFIFLPMGFTLLESCLGGSAFIRLQLCKEACTGFTGRLWDFQIRCIKHGFSAQNNMHPRVWQAQGFTEVTELTS